MPCTMILSQSLCLPGRQVLVSASLSLLCPDAPSMSSLDCCCFPSSFLVLILLCLFVNRFPGHVPWTCSWIPECECLAKHCGALVWSESDHESGVCTRIAWNDWSMDQRVWRVPLPARGSLNKVWAWVGLLNPDRHYSHLVKDCMFMQYWLLCNNNNDNNGTGQLHRIKDGWEPPSLSQDTENGSWVDIPAWQWPKTHGQWNNGLAQEEAR